MRLKINLFSKQKLSSGIKINGGAHTESVIKIQDMEFVNTKHFRYLVVGIG